VSFFVLSPEIEDRGEVEVDNWAKSYLTGSSLLNLNSSYFYNHLNIFETSILSLFLPSLILFPFHFFFIYLLMEY
jgi:hypothetical protein